MGDVSTTEGESMKSLGLCLGIILLAGLTGCATSQTTDATNQSANGPPVQVTPSSQTLQAPSQEQIAQENLDQAQFVCQAQFPSQRGHFYDRQACLLRAYNQYLSPDISDSQRAIQDQYDNNLLAAAKQVDDGTRSIQSFTDYHHLCIKILSREREEAAQADNREAQENGLQAEANYDTEYGDQNSLANETRELAILRLEDEQQELSNDRDSYEYCAGLNLKNLGVCNSEKITFQTDLATYQVMASSVPQAPQSASSTAAETLQQEDIQDDMDAIAGGVVSWSRKIGQGYKLFP